MKNHLFVFVFLFAVMAASLAFGAESSARRVVHVIPISGEIDPAMAAFLDRALNDIPKTPDSLVVLELDTFGGRVDSALDMVESLLDAEVRTVAYVRTKAISAGALVALACADMAMKESTTIGDCAPISYSSEGPKELGEKFQSPLRAKFRALAKRNGYPELLAEAMVTAGMEVYEVTRNGQKDYMKAREFEALPAGEVEKLRPSRVVVAEGELLTMNDSEALDFGFSKMSVSNIDEMLRAMKIEDYELLRIEQSWSERLVGFIGSIAPLLMLIGLAALYVEIKAPGFGAPGILGILCLGVLFLNQYMVGLADHTELLLLGAGLILLGMEVFVIPGFGAAGVAGIVAIAAAMLLALQDFVIPDPSLPWQKELLIGNAIAVLGSVLSAFVVSIAFMRYVFPRLSSAVEGPYLDTTLVEAHADSMSASSVSVGDRGMAMTLLRPAGKMKIGDNVLDVITEGDFFEKGTAIIVVAIRGNVIIVDREGVNGK